MTMALFTSDTHPSIETRVAQFRAFYARRNPRPLLGFFLRSEYPLHRYPAARSLPESRPLVPEDVMVADYVADSAAIFAEYEACGGDFIWAGTPFWGIPWLEAALGCPLVADHASGSIAAHAPTGFAGPDDIPTFSADSPWARKLTEFIDALAAAADGRWPLATTRMRGISDLLSVLYGPEAMVFAMLEKPDQVRRAAVRLTDLWLAWAKLQTDRIPSFHGGIGSFYYSMWAPAGTVWHQEDAAALLSPDLFAEFIAPCDRRIVAALGGCIMHQHPTGYIPYRQYLDMGFAALELHVDEGGPRAEELCAIHREILGRSPLLIWGRLDDADLARIFHEWRPRLASRVSSSFCRPALWLRSYAQAHWVLPGHSFPPMGYPALSPSGSFLFWIEWSLLRLSNDAGARLLRH
jgi:hypothetical protein